MASPPRDNPDKLNMSTVPVPVQPIPLTHETQEKLHRQDSDSDSTNAPIVAVAMDEKKEAADLLTDRDSDTLRLSKDAEQASDTKATYTILNPDGQEEVVTEDDARIRDIPGYVRRVVSFTDDPTEPTLTFRYFLLTILFVAPGAFLSQMAHFRTTYAPYSVFFVQIASNYVGVWLAKVLPDWTIRIPFVPRKYSCSSFRLNPGPFSTKEHVLVTISAASGATYNLGYTPIAMSELYFGERVNGAVAVFFMLAITWTGYSYAALARQFLIYDPQYPWFQA